MMLRLFCGLGALGIAVLSAPGAHAIYIRHDGNVLDNKALAAGFPAVGYFADSIGSFCTGTLVSPTQVLTAAHCVDNNSNGTPDDPVGEYAFGLEVNVPGAPNTNITSIAINPGWVSSNGDAAFDFAVLTLGTPITHVAPALITHQNPVGKLGAAVGYGDQGTGDSHTPPAGADDKLAILNQIERYGDDPVASDNSTLQFDFDSPLNNTSTFGSSNPLGLEGATASGDSGSPLMAKFDQSWFVTGVLNTGYNDFGPEGQYGDVSLYAAVQTSSNLAWLQSQGVRILADTTPIQGDANRNWQVEQGDLDLVLQNWGDTASVSWDTGDLNGNGQVEQGDLDAVLQNWGSTTAPDFRGSTVPEPAAALAMLTLLGGRRSCRCAA